MACGVVLVAKEARGRLQAAELFLLAASGERERLRPPLKLQQPRELAKVVVAGCVRAGGKGLEPVDLLADDRQQPPDESAFRLDGREPRPRRADPCFRLAEGGREPAPLEIRQSPMQIPTRIGRYAGRLRPRTALRPLVPPRDPGDGCAPGKTQPARRVAGRKNLGLDSPDLRSHDRVVELHQQRALADVDPLLDVKGGDHPRHERLHLARAFARNHLTPGRGDDVNPGCPRDGRRGHEQEAEDGDYAHGKRPGGSQRDHIAL